MKGVAAIIGYMPRNDMVLAFREICFIPITPLIQLIEQNTPTLRGTKSDPIIWLDRLSSVFRSVHIKVSNGLLTSLCVKVFIDNIIFIFQRNHILANQLF